MALLHWEPIAELDTIRSEMNRLFDAFVDQGTVPGGGPRWTPPMDLLETTEHYVLRADLPGISDDDVNIQLQDNVLTVSGQRKAEDASQQEGYFRLERAFGVFSRSLTLPDGVDSDAVQAHFDRGVLEIRIPKPEEKKPRQVQIALGERDAIESAESADVHTNNANRIPA
jgi:HSP20 family protein